MTMPQYQRQGYGRFLIDFSYLLSREEDQMGTPEKPLSDLGRLSYYDYWKSIILEYISNHRNDTFVTFNEIALKTGLFVTDIALAFRLLNFIYLKKEEEGIRYEIKINIDWATVIIHQDKIKNTNKRIQIESECLRWTPLLPHTHINFNSIKNNSNDEKNKNDSKVEIQNAKTIAINKFSFKSVKNVLKDNDYYKNSNKRHLIDEAEDLFFKNKSKQSKLNDNRHLNLEITKSKEIHMKTVDNINKLSDEFHDSSISLFNNEIINTKNTSETHPLKYDKDNYSTEDNVLSPAEKCTNLDISELNETKIHIDEKQGSQILSKNKKDMISFNGKPVNVAPKLRGKKNCNKSINIQNDDKHSNKIKHEDDNLKKTNELQNKTLNILTIPDNVKKDSFVLENCKVLEAVAKKTKKNVYAENTEFSENMQKMPINQSIITEEESHNSNEAYLCTVVSNASDSNISTKTQDVDLVVEKHPFEKVDEPNSPISKPDESSKKSINDLIKQRNDKDNLQNFTKLSKDINWSVSNSDRIIQNTPSIFIEPLNSVIEINEKDSIVTEVLNVDSTNCEKEICNVEQQNLDSQNNKKKIFLKNSEENHADKNNEIKKSETLLLPCKSEFIKNSVENSFQKISNEKYVSSVEGNYYKHKKSVSELFKHDTKIDEKEKQTPDKKKMDIEDISCEYKSDKIIHYHKANEKDSIKEEKVSSIISVGSSALIESRYQSKSAVQKQPHMQTSVEINKISSQFPIKQIPNYHTSQYWQWDYYGYNFSHLDASDQKLQNKFHKDLATTMAYSHNFTQNLYQTANLAIQQHAVNHHINQQPLPAIQKDKLKIERKFNGIYKKSDCQIKDIEGNLDSCNYENNQNHTYLHGVRSNLKSCNKPNENHNEIKHPTPVSMLPNRSEDTDTSLNLQNNVTRPAVASIPNSIRSKESQHNRSKESNQNSSCLNTSELNKQHSQEQRVSALIQNISSQYNSISSNTTNINSSNYGQCDIHTQLNLESQVRLSANMSSQSSVDSSRSTNNQQSQQFSDCSMQSHSPTTPMHMSIQSAQNEENNVNINSTPVNSHSVESSASGSSILQDRKISQQGSSSRSTTPKVNRDSLMQPHKNTSSENSISNISDAIGTAHHSLRTMDHAQQQQLHDIHHMQQFGNLSQHGNNQNMDHLDYVLPQMGQNFSFENVPMPTVIQPRLSNSEISHHPVSSRHRNLGPLPSSCAINNYFMQSSITTQSENISNTTQNPNTLSASSTNTPDNITTSSGTISSNAINAVSTSLNPHPQDRISTSTSNTVSGSSPPAVGNICSLSKLQQLTNGLDIQSCNTTSVEQSILTPPPHNIHSAMSSPHLLVNQNRSMTTPPNLMQTQSSLPYHKYYPSNMNISPTIPSLSQNTSRTQRNVSLATSQNVSVSVAATCTSNRSTNVSISSNLIAPYGPINTYRMTTQPSSATAGYIAVNNAAGFTNSQLPVQMGVMNMQSQYPDRTTQQNSMYSSYSPYITLNGHMRR